MAVKDETVIKLHQKFHELLHPSNIGVDMMHNMGWSFVNGLAWIMDQLEGITDNVLSFFGFFKSAPVKQFIQDFKPLLVVLLAISFMYVGYLLIFQRKFDRSLILINMVLAIFMIIALPHGMNKGVEFTKEAVTVIKKQGTKANDTSTADSIIRKNTYDIALLDAKGWKKKSNGIVNYSSDTLRNLSMDSTIDEDFEPKKGKELTEKTQRVLETKLSADAEGEAKLEDLNTGLMSKILPSAYYRFKVNYGPVLWQLLVGSLVLCFITYKLLRVSYDFAMNRVIFNFVAVLNFPSWQKIKVVINDILTSLAIVPVMFINYKMYFWWVEFANHTTNNIILQCIAALVGALAVMDGPNVIEKIVGADAGLKSGWKTAAGLFAGTQAAKNIGEGIKNMTGNFARRAGKTMDFAGAAVGATGGGVAGNLAGYFSNKGKESGGDKTDKKSSPYNSTVTAGKEKPGETSGDGTGGSVPSKDSKEANPLTKQANANTIKAQSPETGSPGTNDSMNTPEPKEDNPLQQNGNMGANQTAPENQKEQHNKNNSKAPTNQADEKDKGNTDANKLQANPKTTTASLSADKSKAAESISPSKASNGSKVASPDQTQGKTTSTSPGNIASPVSSSDTSMMTPSASSGDAISGGGVTGNEPPAGYQDSQNDTSSPEPTTQQVENVSQAVDQAVADQVTPARPTENRTVGEFAKDVVKDKIVRPIANTRTVRTSKKSFEISRNSAIKRASKKNTIPPRGGK